MNEPRKLERNLLEMSELIGFLCEIIAGLLYLVGNVNTWRFWFLVENHLRLMNNENNWTHKLSIKGPWTHDDLITLLHVYWENYCKDVIHITADEAREGIMNRRCRMTSLESTCLHFLFCCSRSDLFLLKCLVVWWALGLGWSFHSSPIVFRRNRSIFKPKIVNV